MKSSLSDAQNRAWSKTLSHVFCKQIMNSLNSLKVARGIEFVYKVVAVTSLFNYHLKIILHDNTHCKTAFTFACSVFDIIYLHSHDANDHC